MTDLSIMTLKGYIEAMKKRHAQNRIEDYAHPADSAVIKVLETLIGKAVMEDAIGSITSAQMGLMLSTGIAVNQRNFPDTYDILIGCCETLRIAQPYTIITNEIPGINALTCGTESFAFVAISGQLSALFRPEEQRFIIGHECGHIAMGHVVYHTMANFLGIAGNLIPVVGPVLAQSISLPLSAWSRCSEITADRAGMICCGDVRTAQRALLRLIGGFQDVSDVDIDSYIETSENSRGVHKLGAYAEFFRSHPLIPKRIRALEKFSHSEMYARVSGKEIQGDLLTDEQLQRATAQILRIH